MSETLLENKLKEAISHKKNDINSFIWKGVKVLTDDSKYMQTSKRLVDMSEVELNSCYTHCKKMLYNEDSKNPGRFIVLSLIAEQQEKCGAELFVRYVETEHEMSRFSLINSINTFKKTNAEVFVKHSPKLEDMFSGIPDKYQSLKLDIILDACLDQLGVFNKKHITRTFILKQGIWLTAEEADQLDPSGKLDKISVIRDSLNLKEIEKLHLNYKGLNYTQMRAMLNLKPNKKYIDLTTSQLETLRYRILFNLENTVENHIEAWEKRMEEIELVAKHNQFNLVYF